MSRENGVLLVGLLVVVATGVAFVYWYWTPVLAFGLFQHDGDVIAGIAEAVPVSDSGPHVDTPAEPITPTPLTQLAPFCGPGQPASFVLGFARLKERLGEDMGAPVECEHVNPQNGDTLQQTTTGLAVFSRDGGLQFTDGWRHWALEGQQLARWEGDDRAGAVVLR